eukprot:CCRYP_016674-RC/>CCRYP_016674-RC protein AED:0.37 eAED:0.37 QI:0/0.5/0.4/1/0.5/0.4/5/0/582
MGRGTKSKSKSKSKSNKNNGISRPTSGNGNAHVTDNNDTNHKTKTKKRHVTFHLSAEKNNLRKSATAKNGNAGSMVIRMQPETAAAAAAARPKQTWLQTCLLLSVLFITLPRLVYRVTNMYCGEGEEECQQRRASFVGGGSILMCRMAYVAIETYTRYMPGSRFMLGISDYGQDRASHDDSKSPLHGSNGESSSSSSPSAGGDDLRRGIIQRVVDRHRRKRKARALSKNKPPVQSDGITHHHHHPLKHVLEGALVFSHWKKRQQQSQQHLQPAQQQSITMESVPIDWKTWKYAMSDDFDLTSQQIALIKELAQRVLLSSKHPYITQDIVEEKAIPPLNTTTTNTTIKSFSERVDSVPWGGVYDQDFTRWWPRRDDSKVQAMGGGSNIPKVSTLSEGGRLLAAYLKIMKWPEDLHVKFPFKLCSKGCNSEIAVLHTLEWREKYLPWCMSPDSIQYNKNGFIYHRGHSRPGRQQRLEAEHTKDMTYFNNAGHSMVWYRPGHDVKAKIHVIPADEEKRKQMLTQFIDLEHVPDWVGGNDDYVFDMKDYYYGSVGGSDKCILSEDKITEYLVTMPYHAAEGSRASG